MLFIITITTRLYVDQLVVQQYKKTKFTEFAYWAESGLSQVRTNSVLDFRARASRNVPHANTPGATVTYVWSSLGM